MSLGTPPTGFDAGRPILFSIFFFGLFDPISQVGLVAGLLLAVWYLVTWESRLPDLRRSHLLLLLLLAAPLTLQGLFITHLEERYLYASMFPAFLLIGSVCWHLIGLSVQDFKLIVVALTVGALDFLNLMASGQAKYAVFSSYK